MTSFELTEEQIKELEFLIPHHNRIWNTMDVGLRFADYSAQIGKVTAYELDGPLPFIIFKMHSGSVDYIALNTEGRVNRVLRIMTEIVYADLL